MGATFFKKPPSKAELRQALDRQVASFLSRGGRIHCIDRGETALDKRSAPLRAPIFDQPKSDRTPLTEVINALDQRRADRLKRKPAIKRMRKPAPRKKVLYDDFGEALRTVWADPQ